MRKGLLTLLGLTLLLAGAQYTGWLDRGIDYLNRTHFREQLLSKISDQELLPGPLRGSLEAQLGNLTLQGVVDATNEQRQSQNLAPLHMNTKLNAAAKVKLDDMFAQGYFEHVSPQGVAPADLAKQAHYEYILVGENLALGNFKDDVTLVEAWMNSPGHRANILNKKFQEIGVAVGKGTYEGRTVWMAVQEFGTPLSTCPNPNTALKESISINKAQIDRNEAELRQRKAELERSRYASNEEYNRAVEEYNTLAQATNNLIDQTRTLIEQYNQQVSEFNNCLERNG